jgi:hypothetical protein
MSNWASKEPGRTLAEVRDAAGHANVSITSGYLNVAVDDEAKVGNLFGFVRKPSIRTRSAGNEGCRVR